MTRTLDHAPTGPALAAGGGAAHPPVGHGTPAPAGGGAAPDGRTLATKLADVLDGRWAEGRRASRAAWPASGMLRDPALTMTEARAWTLERVQTIVAAGFGRAGTACLAARSSTSARRATTSGSSATPSTCGCWAPSR